MSIPYKGFFASCGLKKFQLLGYFYRVCRLFAMENFHHAELLVCNRHDTDMPFFREYFFYPFYMNLSIFHAGAMPQVYGKLEHTKPVGQDLFPEIRIYFTVFLCFRWQVEKYKHPHNTVCV